MSRSIHLLACVAAVATVVADPASSRAGDQPAAAENVVRELYVPFNDLNVLLESKPQHVLLSRSEFDDLLAKACSRPRSTAPLAAAILSGDYEVSVDQERAGIKGRLTIEVLGDGVHSLPLDLAGVGLVRANLDGKSAAVGRSREGKLVLFVEGRGRRTLDLDLVTPLTATAAQQMLRFRLPAATASTLFLSVPGDVEVKSGAKVVSRVFDSAAQRTRFELLAGQGETTIVMTLNSHLLRRERTVVAKAVVVDEVTRNYERLHATFSMAVLHKAVDGFRFAVPVGFEVTHVASPLLARWSIVADEQNGRVLNVRLSGQSSQTEVLSISAIRSAPPPATWTFPVIKALDVVGDVSVIGLLLEDRMKVQGIEPSNLIPIDTDVLNQALPATVFQADPGAPQIRPVVAYYAPQPEFSLGASFQKPSGRLAATANMLLTLTDKAQKMRAGFTLVPELEKLFAVDVSIPESWQVTEVTAGDGSPLPIERFTGRIQVRLPKGVPAGEPFTLLIQAVCSPPGWLADWTSTKVLFPAFGIPAAGRATGALAVTVEGDLTVRPEGLERLVPIDESEKHRYGLGGLPSSLVYRFDDPAYLANLAVERIQPRLTGRTYSFLAIQPDVLIAHYELACEVEQAKVRRLDLSLPADTPEALAITGIDGLAIKEYTSRTDLGRRHWTVLLEEPQGDAVRLAVDFQQPFGREVENLDLPVIWAEGLAHQSGFVAVEGSPDLDVKITTPLRKVDVGELAGAKYQPGKRLVGTYCFVGEPEDTKASVSRHPGYDLPSVLVQRADLLTVLGSRGISQNAARLCLRSKDQWLEVELPAGARLWSAQVDGQTIKPQRQNQRLLISLSSVSEARLHDLQFVYEMPVAAGGFRQDVDLLTPKLLLRRPGSNTPIPVADLAWQVCPPEGYRLISASGTVVADTFQPDELALTRLCKALYRLAGGINPFYIRKHSGPLDKAAVPADVSTSVSSRAESRSTGRVGIQASLGVDIDGDGAVREEAPEGPRQKAGVPEDLPDGIRSFGEATVAAPPSPPVPSSDGRRAFRGLEGLRSLRIDLQQPVEGFTFRSFGDDPRLTVALLNERRSAALAWGLAFAVGLWGVRLANRPVRGRAKYVVAVALVTTLVPLVSGSSLWTQLLNPSFYAAAGLVSFYLLVGALRWLVRGLQRPSLTVPTGSALVVAALLLAGQPARAASTPAPLVLQAEPAPPVEVPEDAIIVPYDPEVSIDHVNAERILVPYGRYVDLWNRAHPGETPTQPAAPVPCAVGGVVVRGTLGGDDHLLLEAQADLDLYVDGPVAVPLPLTSGVLVKAELDGQPAHLGAVTTPPETSADPAAENQQADASPVAPPGPALVLSVSGKGRHRLVLAVQMKLDRSGGWRILRGRLLGTETGTLALTVPEPQTEVQFTNVPDRKDYLTRSRNELIETAFGRAGIMSLQWRPKVGEGALDQSLTAQSTALFDVQEESVRLVWRVALEFRRGERSAFRLDLPSGYLVTRVTGPNVRGWQTTATAAGQQLQVALLKPAKDHEQFDIHLSRRGPVGSTARAVVEVPAVSVPDAALHNGRLTIRRSPLLELRAETTAGLSRIDLQSDSGSDDLALSVDSPLGIRPFASYRFTALPFTFRLAASPTAGRITARTETILRIAQRERSLEARINLDVQGRPMYRAALLLPGDLRLDRVSAPGPFEWATTRQDAHLRLEIILATGHTGAVPILISGRLGEVGISDQIPLPRLEVPGVQRQEGDLVVQTEAGWRVEARDLDQCEPILLKRVYDWLTPQQREPARLALHCRGPGYAGRIHLVPLVPLVRCRTISNARVTDRAIEETVLLDLTVERAGIREVSFLLPESMKGARISVPHLRQRIVEPAGADHAGLLRVRLSLQDKVMGQLRVLVENDRVLSSELHQVSMPIVEDAKTDQRFALIENTGRYEVEVTTHEGLTPVSRQLSQWQRLSEILGGNITSAYLADPGTGRPLLAFRLKDRAIVETVGARIGLTQTWMSVDAAGTYRAVQAYRVDNSTEQFMEVQLPPGVQVWTVSVAGEPVKPTQTADPNRPDHLLIPLVKTAAGDLDYEVLLKYGGSLGELGGLSKVTFPLVRPVNIKAELSQVRLYLPEGYRWFDFGGTMTQSQDEAGMAAGFIAYQTKRARRLMQAMRDASSFTRLRAVSNLDVLKSEVDEYRALLPAQPSSAGTLQQELYYNDRVIEGAARQSEEVARELGKLEVGGDNRTSLNRYYVDQGLTVLNGAAQTGTTNFVYDLELAASKPADDKSRQFDDRWFASNSLVVQGGSGAAGGPGPAKGNYAGRRMELNAPILAPAPPPPPSVLDAPAKPEGKLQAISKGGKKSKSLETLDQYRQALNAQKRGMQMERSGQPVRAPAAHLADSIEFFSSINDVLLPTAGQIAQTQPAIAKGLASLDIDIRHAGTVYRFTAPLGETTITVRAVSQSAVDVLKRLGLALLVVLVAILVFRFGWSVLHSGITRPKAGLVLILLGVISIGSGVLPFAGLGLIAAGVVLAVRRQGFRIAPSAGPR